MSIIEPLERAVRALEANDLRAAMHALLTAWREREAPSLGWLIAHLEAQAPGLLDTFSDVPGIEALRLALQVRHAEYDEYFFRTYPGRTPWLDDAEKIVRDRCARLVHLVTPIKEGATIYFGGDPEIERAFLLHPNLAPAGALHCAPGMLPLLDRAAFAPTLAKLSTRPANRLEIDALATALRHLPGLRRLDLGLHRTSELVRPLVYAMRGAASDRLDIRIRLSSAGMDLYVWGPRLDRLTAGIGHGNESEIFALLSSLPGIHRLDLFYVQEIPDWHQGWIRLRANQQPELRELHIEVDPRCAQRPPFRD